MVPTEGSRTPVRPHFSQSNCIATFPPDWTYGQFTARDFASVGFTFDISRQAPSGPYFVTCTLCKQRNALSRIPTQQYFTPYSTALHKRGSHFCSSYDDSVHKCEECCSVHIIRQTECCGLPVSICSKYLRDIQEESADDAANDVDIHGDGGTSTQHVRNTRKRFSLVCPHCHADTFLKNNELNIQIRA